MLDLTALAQTPADLIGQESVIIYSGNAIELLESKVSDLHLLIENYHIALDRGSSIVVPQQISGTLDHPVMKVSVRKCVFFICKLVDIDMEFNLKKANGQCDLNYILSGDLRRSSLILSETYTEILLDVCFMANHSGGILKFTGSAVHGPAYSSGLKQNQVLGLLQLQMPALLTSLRIVLGSAINPH